MSDQILAVYKNVLKPRGSAVDAGDLVLTNQCLCFVQLAAWAPNVNANPLLTAVTGVVGGLGAAAVTTIGSVARQKPEIVKLLASADKKRNMLWGMNLDERLLKTNSRWVIPTEEVSFERSSNGVGVSVKDKRVGALSQTNLTHFELYPTEGLDSELQSILQAWKSHQIAAQAVEGYASKFPAPQLFLDALVTGSSAEAKCLKNEMLSDSDYLAHLQPLFKELKYPDQCQVLSTLRHVSASELASLLHGQLITSLREQLEKAIRDERWPVVSIWWGIIGVPLSGASFLAGVVFIVLASIAEHNSEKQNSAIGYMSLCFILLFFSALAALAWTVPFVRAKNARKRLQEQGVDPQKSEAELRSTATATTDSQCSFTINELHAAFSADSTKEQFFKKLYSRPWKMQRVTFQRFQDIAESDVRVTLAASAKAEGNRRKRSGLQRLTFGLLAGGVVWLFVASIPPHGYGPNAAPFIFVLAIAIFVCVCAIAAPVCLVSSILEFAASSRYGRVAKALSQ